MKIASFVGRYRSRIISGILSASLMLVAVLFLFLDRTGRLSHAIQAYGTGGVLSAILVMSVFCVTPVPSEGLLLMYFKIYGVFLGAFCAWTGFMLGSFIVFGIARLLGQRLVKAWVSPAHLQAVDNWVATKGVMGLVIVRLLPIPAFVINLVTGSLSSITFWDYTWTGAVTIVPYYIATGSIFIGASGRHLYVVLVGTGVFGLTWLMQRWWQKTSKTKHDSLDIDVPTNS